VLKVTEIVLNYQLMNTNAAKQLS